MRLRERLPAIAFDRPVTVLMGFLALLVIGVIAYTRIPVQMMPSGFESKFLFIWAPYPGGSPIETDERVLRPIEEQISTVPGIKRMRSTAATNAAQLALSFWGSVDMKSTYNAVMDRMERAMPELPDQVERYWIFRFNPDDTPVIWAGASLPPEVDDPWHVLENIVKPRIERVPGVASLDVYGVNKNVVAVEYERAKLFAHLIDLGSVHRRLQSDNFQQGSGRIVERGRVRPVRSLSNLAASDLARFPVRDSLVLGDIAKIRRGGLASADLSRIDGEEAAGLAVKKESDANTVEVGQRVTAELEALEADPRVQGMQFHVFFDQGGLIQDSVDTLTNTALTGGLFAVIILYVFLREWRMTLLIAASIPLSLLLTVAALYFGGSDLNLISLMGLMLAVGMVVDNAIVVVETIYTRRGEGLSPRQAAIEGTGEVNLAILASTATTMVVFLPVMLMSENAEFSFFLRVMGMPVVLALAASLLVALVFAPLATRYIGSAQIKTDPRWLGWVEARYRVLLGWVLRQRADTAIGIVALLMITVMIVVPGVKCAGGGDSNLNDFVIRFEVPPQFGSSRRDEALAAFEDVVESHREAWGVRVYRSELQGDRNQGQVHVYLESDGPMPRDQVMEQARAALPSDLPGVSGSVGWEGDQDNANTLSLRIEGEQVRELMGLADEVVRRVEDLEGVVDVRIDQEREGRDEIRLQVHRDAGLKYGVGATQIGTTVSYSLRAQSLPALKEDGREVELRSSFSLEDRSDIDTVRDFQMFSQSTGGFVPIRVLTDLELGKGPVSINRIDRRTSVSISVDVAEDVDVGKFYGDIDKALSDMAFPRGTGWKKGDAFDMQIENDAAMLWAMVLSVSFVFLLMGTLFESVILPAGILTTIPMAVFGSLWGLWITGTPMDTMAGVGLVILVGVVVNNGIVLVDKVTQLRAEGVERTEALIEAGCRRLRPILMTAMTTICGLLPMALGSSAFIGISYAPLGRTVIFGLTASTLLTLVLIPFLYAWLDDFSAGFRGWLGYVTSARRTETA